MDGFCDRGIVDGLLIKLPSIDSHSDIHNINGELPMTTNVAGHEGIGRVVKGLYFSLKLTRILNSDMVQLVLIHPQR